MNCSNGRVILQQFVKSAIYRLYNDTSCYQDMHI